MIAYWTDEERAILLSNRQASASKVQAILRKAGYDRSRESVRIAKCRLNTDTPIPSDGSRRAKLSEASRAVASWPQGLCNPYAEDPCRRHMEKDSEHVRRLLKAQLAEIRRERRRAA